jgi:hypothetical protein
MAPGQLHHRSFCVKPLAEADVGDSRDCPVAEQVVCTQRRGNDRRANHTSDRFAVPWPTAAVVVSWIADNLLVSETNRYDSMYRSCRSRNRLMIATSSPDTRSSCARMLNYSPRVALYGSLTDRPSAPTHRRRALNHEARSRSAPSRAANPGKAMDRFPANTTTSAGFIGSLPSKSVAPIFSRWWPPDGSPRAALPYFASRGACRVGQCTRPDCLQTQPAPPAAVPVPERPSRLRCLFGRRLLPSRPATILSTETNPSDISQPRR